MNGSCGVSRTHICEKKMLTLLVDTDNIQGLLQCLKSSSRIVARFAGPGVASRIGEVMRLCPG